MSLRSCYNTVRPPETARRRVAITSDAGHVTGFRLPVPQFWAQLPLPGPLLCLLEAPGCHYRGSPATWVVSIAYLAPFFFPHGHYCLG
jgi:hypothetical protein